MNADCNLPPITGDAIPQANCLNLCRLTITVSCISGGADGLVRFFDGMLRLCAWFEELDAGPVACVSFATKGQQHTQALMQLQRYSVGWNHDVSRSQSFLCCFEYGITR